jgi:hypothetical protein
MLLWNVKIMAADACIPIGPARLHGDRDGSIELAECRGDCTIGE